MRHPGITIFLLFFGIGLLDALWAHNWGVALFWIVVGAVFFLLDRARRGHPRGEDAAESQSR